MYLTKPFNPIELISFVKRILEGNKGVEGPKRYDL
jgi:DNA-binding response OmpR family regulator